MPFKKANRKKPKEHQEEEEEKREEDQEEDEGDVNSSIAMSWSGKEEWEIASEHTNTKAEDEEEDVDEKDVVIVEAVNDADQERNNIEKKDSTEESSGPAPVIKLYKSTRLKGYMTLALASFINYDAGNQSGDSLGQSAVESTTDQYRYAKAVSSISLVISTCALVVHFDRLTPLKRLWIKAFQPNSRFELVIAVFLVIWWTVAIGIETSVTGIAGDGKNQFSFYYSAWVCCLSSYSILERWFVAAGWSSLKSFITSWPNRAPAWISIMFLSLCTLIWYLDLWKNGASLAREEEAGIQLKFEQVPDGQWQWLVIVTVFTFAPATGFVLVELFRETRADGGVTESSSGEKIFEGFCVFTLILAWIPTVMIATTPGGAASLIGNAYYFTWILVIFVFDCFVWYIHDLRKELHLALKEKEHEYKKHQLQVLQEAREIQGQQMFLGEEGGVSMDSTAGPRGRSRTGTSEFYDASETEGY